MNNSYTPIPYFREGNIFENNGLYDVNKLIHLKYKSKPVEFDINVLKGDLSGYPVTSAVRKISANLEVPILVWKDPHSGWIIVDGRHRSQKALDNNISKLPAYILSDSEMAAVKITNEKKAYMENIYLEKIAATYQVPTIAPLKLNLYVNTSLN